MNASKENAALAKKAVQVIASRAGAEFSQRYAKGFQLLTDFLNAAHRKLPTEASYERAANPKEKQ